MKLYRTFRTADEAIKDKIVLLEGQCTKLEVQLEFLGKISNQLDERLAESQLNLLGRLQGKLLLAVSQMEMPTSKYLRRFKYTAVKERLDELMRDLEAWQTRFDPTWYMIILIGNSTIDTTLKSEQGKDGAPSASPLNNMVALRHAIQSPDTKASDGSQVNLSVNLDISGLADATDTPIPFSTARTVIRRGSAKILIAQSIDCQSGNIAHIKADAESLAKRLKQIDPDTFGLLRCYGILKRRDENNRLNAIEMIYRTPQDCGPPNSLRQLLSRQDPVSASAIVKMAKQLVQSVSYVHACDFVHKNIRPENILIFPDNSNSSSLGSSFLVGFNQFRNTNFQTNLVGDPHWHSNLYRHKERQGMFVEERYVMQHDIYSLGVCLLELGLWRSFVWYPDDTGEAAPVPALALGMGLSDADFQSPQSETPPEIKEHLVSLATRELPPRLGDIYTDVVVACLTCLDPGNEAFGSEEELKDEDGILIGVKFVETILLRIADISL